MSRLAQTRPPVPLGFGRTSDISRSAGGGGRHGRDGGGGHGYGSRGGVEGERRAEGGGRAGERPRYPSRKETVLHLS